MRRSTDKAKFCCCTDQRKWPLPCKVDFSALFICKVASGDFRFKNQNIENNNKINTCKFRMRSYREFSSPLVQESLYQLLRKSHLVSNCLLEGPCISDGLMKASTFPHTTRMTQSRVCLCNSSYLYSWHWPICSPEDTLDQSAIKLQISETFTLLHVNFCVYAYTDLVFLLH